VPSPFSASTVMPPASFCRSTMRQPSSQCTARAASSFDANDKKANSLWCRGRGCRGGGGGGDGVCVCVCACARACVCVWRPHALALAYALPCMPPTRCHRTKSTPPRMPEPNPLPDAQVSAAPRPAPPCPRLHLPVDLLSAPPHLGVPHHLHISDAPVGGEPLQQHVLVHPPTAVQFPGAKCGRGGQGFEGGVSKDGDGI
jgi:hypothetical protein